MNKKRILAFVFVAILMISTLAGCSESTGGTVYIPDNSLEVIKDRGKLIVGTAPGYFPFEMINEDNEVIGYDIDIATYLAESLGVELEIADYDWNGLTPALQTDKIDLLLSGMTITGPRAANVDFSIPYFRTGQSLMVNKENPNIETIEDVDKEGMKVAVIMGSSGAVAAEKMFKNAEIVEYQGATEAGLACTTGKVDALFYDQPWIATWQIKNSDQVYSNLEVLTAENLGIAIKQGNVQLKNFVDSALTALKDTPKYDEMFDTWFVDMEWLDEVEVE